MRDSKYNQKNKKYSKTMVNLVLGYIQRNEYDNHIHNYILDYNIPLSQRINDRKYVID